MQRRSVQNEASTGYDKQNELCGICGIETNFKADIGLKFKFDTPARPSSRI